MSIVWKLLYKFGYRITFYIIKLSDDESCGHFSNRSIKNIFIKSFFIDFIPPLYMWIWAWSSARPGQEL